MEDTGRMVLNMPQVLTKVSASRTWLFEQIRAGAFPAPIPLGGRRVGFLLDEVEAWLSDRIADRDAKRRRVTQ
jgi:prophage regulatory protein